MITKHQFLNTQQTTFVCVVLATLIFFAYPYHIAHSQTQFEQVSNTANLKMVPTYPEPDSTVVISLDAYTVDTSGATIAWYIDGEEVTASRNERSMQLRLGKIGQTNRVTARVTLISGASFSLKKDITATAVDLVVEADTYVPSFYRGRSLPSVEAQIRVIAVPHLGSAVNPANLSYRWEYEGGLMFGGPVRGKQSIDLVVSPYSGGYVLLTVMDENGAVVAGKTLSIDTGVDPELYFYEESPLRGLSESAITNGTLALIGEETIIHGEPFFLAKDVSTDNVNFVWRINNEETVSENADPHTITLRKSGGSGSVRIDLQAMTTTPLPRYVANAFTITF